MLQAGVGKACITPQTGAPLAGFAARAEVSRGTHDDLYARALVLDNGRTAVALVSVDVLALSGEFVNGVRRAIAARVPLPAGAILIASTHTHSGPVTIRTFFNPDESVDAQYMQRLAGAIQEAVAAAWEGRRAARVGVGSGRIEGLGVNRRSPDRRPVDEEIGIVRVDDAAGRATAVLMNYACHPTVLGPDNLLISGDFPAMAVERVEAALGAGGFAMFVNGTQGDISVGHSSELSAIGVITPGRTFARATELGRQLGDSVMAALGGISTSGELELQWQATPVNLPLKRFPPAEETARALRESQRQLERLREDPDSEEYRHSKSEFLYRSITHYYAVETSGLPNGSLPIELQGLRIGESLFIAVPAEVFVEVGLRMKRTAPRRIYIIGIANGYIGYLPSRRAYEAGGYEVISAQCGPEAEDRLVEGVTQLQKRLAGQ